MPRAGPRQAKAGRGKPRKNAIFAFFWCFCVLACFCCVFMRFDALCVFARSRVFLHVCTCFACFSVFSRVCARFCDKAFSLTVLHTFCLPGAGVEKGSLRASSCFLSACSRCGRTLSEAFSCLQCKSSVGEVDVLLALLSWSHETHDCVLDSAVSFVQGIWVNGLLKICWMFCFSLSCCFADALCGLMPLVVWEPFLSSVAERSSPLPLLLAS